MLGLEKDVVVVEVDIVMVDQPYDIKYTRTGKVRYTKVWNEDKTSTRKLLFFSSSISID